MKKENEYQRSFLHLLLMVSDESKEFYPTLRIIISHTLYQLSHILHIILSHTPYHHLPYSVSSFPILRPSYLILRIIISHTPYHHILYSISYYPILGIIKSHTPCHHILYSISYNPILRIIMLSWRIYIFMHFVQVILIRALSYLLLLLKLIKKKR